MSTVRVWFRDRSSPWRISVSDDEGVQHAVAYADFPDCERIFDGWKAIIVKGNEVVTSFETAEGQHYVEVLDD